MREVKIGDVVRLRSGGPKMTVTDLRGPHVECAWFDKDDLVHKGTFRIDMLDVVDEEAGRLPPFFARPAC